MTKKPVVKKKAGRIARPVKEKAPWYSGRKLFIYAEDLRVGDVIEIHASREWKPGLWQNEICRGPVLSVDRDTQSTYSKTLVMVHNLEFDGAGAATQQHALSNMSYIRLIP